MSIFLTQEDIAQLTGIRRGHAKQCAQLDKMYIPYRLNARGEPIVTHAFINGTKEAPKTTHWQSNLKVA